jgi:DNA-binding PadR family transcriptional regulator
MKEQLLEEILGLLNVAPDGLSAPALQRGLRQKPSQPTLWRGLAVLRSRGLVTVQGRGRATRYYSLTRTDPAARRSLRLHENAARRIVRDPALRERVRARLEQLRRVNPHGRVYHDRWEQLLEGPLPRLLRVMTEDSETADDLRKESPLTILVGPAERRRAFQSVRA